MECEGCGKHQAKFIVYDEGKFFAVCFECIEVEDKVVPSRLISGVTE